LITAYLSSFIKKVTFSIRKIFGLYFTYKYINYFLSRLFSLITYLIISEKLEVRLLLDTYRLLFITLITIVISLLQVISILIIIGLGNILDSNSGNIKQIFSFLNLFIAISNMILISSF
jgi:hypothetical protein